LRGGGGSLKKLQKPQFPKKKVKEVQGTGHGERLHSEGKDRFGGGKNRNGVEEKSAQGSVPVWGRSKRIKKLREGTPSEGKEIERAIDEVRTSGAGGGGRDGI